MTAHRRLYRAYDGEGSGSRLRVCGMPSVLQCVDDLVGDRAGGGGLTGDLDGESSRACCRRGALHLVPIDVGAAAAAVALGGDGARAAHEGGERDDLLTIVCSTFAVNSTGPMTPRRGRRRSRDRRRGGSSRRSAERSRQVVWVGELAGHLIGGTGGEGRGSGARRGGRACEVVSSAPAMGWPSLVTVSSSLASHSAVVAALMGALQQEHAVGGDLGGVDGGRCRDQKSNSVQGSPPYGQASASCPGPAR
jgi:hypothetical protein